MGIPQMELFSPRMVSGRSPHRVAHRVQLLRWVRLLRLFVPLIALVASPRLLLSVRAPHPAPQPRVRLRLMMVSPQVLWVARV